LSNRPNHYLPLGVVSDEHIMDEIIAVGYPAGHKPENTHIKIYSENSANSDSDDK